MRIGRTGRAGVKGKAFTLISEKDKEMAGHLVRNLEQANQDVPKELMNLAMKSSWFKNSRFRKSGKAGFGSANHMKIGLGFKNSSDRPCLGQPQSQEDSLSNYLTSKESPGSGSTGALGGGRGSALKSAFKSQYMSRFCKSADSGANSTNTITHGEGATSVTNTISATDLMQNTQGRAMFSKPAPPPPPPTFPAYANPNSEMDRNTSESSNRKRKSRFSD